MVTEDGEVVGTIPMGKHDQEGVDHARLDGLCDGFGIHRELAIQVRVHVVLLKQFGV